MSRRSYLLCYDIADPRRLSRIHRICGEFGISFQYSVFLMELEEEEVDALLERIEGIIDHNEDDVRLYPIQSKKAIVTLGEPLLPEEIHLF